MKTEVNIFRSDKHFKEWLKKEAEKREMTVSGLIIEALKKALVYKSNI
jgi:hypothetical protein